MHETDRATLTIPLSLWKGEAPIATRVKLTTDNAMRLPLSDVS